jgi:hypothetical protein
MIDFNLSKLGFIVIIMVCGFVLLLFIALKLGVTKHPSRYRIGKALFSPTEKEFFLTLEQVLPSHYRLLGKVRIADILTPDIPRKNKNWWASFAKISQKHFDYVIVTAQSLTPVAAIELDDNSHNSKVSQQRDQLVNEACHSAAFTLVRFKASPYYNAADISTYLGTYLQGPFDVDNRK